LQFSDKLNYKETTTRLILFDLLSYEYGKWKKDKSTEAWKEYKKSK